MIKKRKKLVIRIVLIGIIVSLVFLTIFFMLPRGRIVEGEVRIVSEDSVEFLYDLTYEYKNGSVAYDHQIFDRVFEMIDGAEKFVIVDMFLFGTAQNEVYRNLTSEFKDHLLAKKVASPDVKIYFISDYYNVLHGNERHFKELKDAGIKIVFSSWDGKRILGERNFFDTFLKKYRGKLNHKKIVIADSGNKIVSLITSANPHDASSSNSNVGFYFEGGIWRDVYGLEKEDSLIEDYELDLLLEDFDDFDDFEGEGIFVQYLADGGLMYSLKEEIDNTVEGGSIDILIFWLSDRGIVDSLKRASNRGVNVRLIMDLNIEAFGKKTFGVPNRPVADYLVKDSNGKILVKWYIDTGGQFHTKMAIIGKENEVVIYLGSSNFATNNLILYNSQADVKVVAPLNSSVSEDVNDYFYRLWFNEGGNYTVDYKFFEDDSLISKLRYWKKQLSMRFI